MDESGEKLLLFVLLVVVVFSVDIMAVDDKQWENPYILVSCFLFELIVILSVICFYMSIDS